MPEVTSCLLFHKKHSPSLEDIYSPLTRLESVSHRDRVGILARRLHPPCSSFSSHCVLCRVCCVAIPLCLMKRCLLAFYKGKLIFQLLFVVCPVLVFSVCTATHFQILFLFFHSPPLLSEEGRLVSKSLSNIFQRYGWSNK